MLHIILQINYCAYIARASYGVHLFYSITKTETRLLKSNNPNTLQVQLLHVMVNSIEVTIPV